MALTPDGEIAGSVSGGCVEAAVVEAGLETLKTDRARLLHFGVADEAAWGIGLVCGGSIDIFVETLDPDFFQAQRSALVNECRAVVIKVIRAPGDMLGHKMLVRADGAVTGTLGAEWDQGAMDLAGKILLSNGTSRRVTLSESIEVFVEIILPQPVLIAVGGVHIAIALASLAQTLGYRTVVVDPRKSWGSAERFPHVDQLIQAWPDEAFRQIQITSSTAVAMLTHDPKLDDPALQIVLASPAFYVGALGGRRTQDKRRQRLLGAGLAKAHLARLHAPIGLEIGAETPEEIALAIMAEVVDAHRRQTAAADILSARQLRQSVGEKSLDRIF
ncbi:MAG: hypothetical protein A2Z03_03240 [Chloroflexi bacterium RBG_16_56_8]|nr:MAG: hypothetical protein A2Z03_03240 [Chloroflexi bacterium RBG_16_56_8]